MGSANVEQLITDHIDLWTSAIENKSSSGRGSSKKQSLYGIKKLRELILELAVRGKLVPQDPNDEPASKLLERITEERDQLVKDKKIKKPKKLPEISDDEKVFSLPDGWNWMRLGDLSEIIRGVSYKKNELLEELNEQTITLLRANNINNVLNFQEVQYIPKSLVNSDQVLLKGDLLIAMSSGSPHLVGKAAQAVENLDATFGAFCAVIRAHSTSIHDYFGFYLKTPCYRLQAQRTGKGIGIQNLNKTALSEILIPIPPGGEQGRIVAKVNELMALCDQLEEQTENNIEAHQILVEALLGTLIQSQNAEELAENWERVAEHFDTLFTTEHSIDQLKQTILQLAVMGKLVPQDPNDEPASVLLEHIAAEKEKLIKDKMIKKQKVLPHITEDEKPFDLPLGWEWCRFSGLVNEVATGPFGSMINKKEYVDGGVPLINPSHMNNSQIQEDSSISVTYEKAQELSTYRIKKGDVVMARRGEMGRCALVTEREHNWLCGTGSFVLRFSETVCRPYILLLFRTTWIKEYLGGNSIGTTMVNLNHGILNKMPLLVPPACEQQRIVSKVEQLMAFCDQLKSRLQHAQQSQLDLVGALVKGA